MELTPVQTEPQVLPPAPLAHQDDFQRGSTNQEDGLFWTGWHATFPKVERIPWRTFWTLLAWISVPTTLYLLLFTRMGYGLLVYSHISQYLEPYALLLSLITAGYFCILYLFDFMPVLHPSYIFVWSKTSKSLQQSALLLGGFAAGGVVLSLAGDYPYGPIALFLVATSAWMVGVRQFTSFQHVPARVFLFWCSGPFLFMSFVVLVAWLAWGLLGGESSRRWNSDEIYQVALEAAASACDANLEDFPNCQSNNDDGVCFSMDYETSTLQFPGGCDESCASNVYHDCLNPFILFVGPFLLSLCLLCLSFMATFLRATSPETDHANNIHSSVATITPPAEIKDDMIRFAKGWLILLFAMWVSASLAGAGAGLSTALTAMTVAAFVASAIFGAVSFNAMERKAHATGLQATLTALEAENPTVFDAVKALLVLTCTPVALLYLAVAVVKQKIRCAFQSNPCVPAVEYEEEETPPANNKNAWVTVEAQRLIAWTFSWERRTTIFTYAVYWGVAYLIMNVLVAQFTILFLSWLIERTSEMALGSVTLILMGVGLIMFLLPPVPGVPIYLTLGIVIIPVGRDTMGVAGSIAYAMVVCTCLKLLACTLQQKLIGGLLQHQVAVRQFVGVNSKVIRSMRLILAEPGLGVAKVSILVGGPDWPTSVLCGIMDLSLIPILVGTLPVVFLIFPTLLTGCFAYMGSLVSNGEAEFPWADTMATVSAAVTGLVQFGSMVVAAFFLEQTVAQRGAELDAIPYDEEVRAADEKLEESTKAYDKVTEWNVVPAWAKTVLSASLVCIIVSCYMLQLLQDLCFTPYELTYTIDEHLGGDWRTLVMPLGLVAIGLFLVSLVLLSIFISWAKRCASQLVAASAEGTPFKALAES